MCVNQGNGRDFFRWRESERFLCASCLLGCPFFPERFLLGLPAFLLVFSPLIDCGLIARSLAHKGREEKEKGVV
jgi:hypothetical protein